MSSLLASKLPAARRGIPITRSTRQWQRSSIHFWHSLLVPQAEGQAKFIDYEDLPVPDIGSQEIQLWSKGEQVRKVPVKTVISDYLGPGTMLKLRGRPPIEKDKHVPESYEYEVCRLQTANPKPKPKPKRPRRAAYTLCLDALSNPSHLQNLLEAAYRLLSTSTSGGSRQLALEMHMAARPMSNLTGLPLFTWGRVDLHPAVIQRAMPEGTFQIISPKIDIQRRLALWVMAPKIFRFPGLNLEGSPSKMARTSEKIVLMKQEWLRGLIDAGDLTPKGIVTEQGKLRGRPNFDLKKKLEGGKPGDALPKGPMPPISE